MIPIDPNRLFEIKGNDASRLLSVQGSPAVGNNTQIIAAVTGKRIRVMGWILQSNGSIGTIQFKSASGGTALTPVLAIPANSSVPWVLEVKQSGYFETNTGEGLFCDVATTQINLFVNYLVFTP